MMITRRAFTASTLTAAAATALAACGGSGFSSDSSSGGSGTLTLLYAPSGDAETKAYTDAIAAFTKETGIEVEATAALLKGVMEGVAQLRVPLLVEVGSGRNWAEAH